MKNVAGRVAFVTGGLGGIGLGITSTFLKAGMKVAATYRDLERAAPAIDHLRGLGLKDLLPIQLDVTHRSSVNEAAEDVERSFGNIHVVCNNAGVNLLGPMDEATYEDWDWMLSVNLGGVVNVLMAFLPKIKSHGKGGHVINVASMAAIIPGPRYGVYATTKYAVRGLSECLRYDLAKHDIGVSLLCPGLTKSRIFESTLRRPAEFGDTGAQPDEVTLKNLASAHALGMEANEVGQHALDGMLRNDFFIFSHPEFKNEVREVFEEVLDAFPDWEPDTHPERLKYEVKRKQAKEEAHQQILKMKRMTATP